MKINSKLLAQTCVALLILYPVSAILVWAYLRPDDSYSILAALLAVNAGMAFLVHLTFTLPEFIDYTSHALRLSVLIIASASGFVSAVYWMVDAIDNTWLYAGIISPILAFLLVLVWFVHKVDKEKAKNEDKP